MASVAGSTRIVPPGVSSTPSAGLQERQVGLLADGEDAGVGVERQHVLVVVAGAEAAVLVEDRDDAPQLDLLEPPVAEEPLRPAAGQEGDALLLRLLELLVPLRRLEHRHLGEALERDDRDLGGAAAQRGAGRVEGLLHPRVGLAGELGRLLLAAEAQRGAGGVEGHEAAADHHHPAAEVHPVAAVHVEEVVDGLHDAVELDARDLQVAALRDADGEEDGLEAVARAARRGRRTSVRRDARAQGHAEREDLLDLLVDERAGQAVLGDAEAHHPARLGGGVEDRDVVAEEGEVVGGGHARPAPRRPPPPCGAWPRRRPERGATGRCPRKRLPSRIGCSQQPVLRVGAARLDAVPLGDVALQGADRDRARRCCRAGRRPRRAPRRRGRRPRRRGWARARRGRPPRRAPRRSAGRSGRRRS